MTYMTPFEKHQHDQKKVVPLNSSIRLPWAKDVLTSSEYRPRENQPSGNMLFHEEETEKKRLGKANGIDIALIKAAAKGFKNEWSERVKRNPKAFAPILCNSDGYDWEEILKA